MTGTAANRLQILFGETVLTPRVVRLSKRYSRFVGLMKILLPLAAAALTLVIVSLSNRDSGPPSFQLNLTDAQTGEETVGMTRGRFVGADERARPYVITADSATPEANDANRIVLRALQADLTVEKGSWITLIAPSGLFDRLHQTLSLSDHIEMFADNGFALRTTAADIDIGKGIASGTAPIEAQGPLGSLTANGFRLSRDDQVLSFSGGVHVTLRPKAK
ncbi:MAG: hypothetical protein EXQ85_00115 [Alphaproteobacteria bacterium]|nr:hypothetical protein [Alphaproteobacteria bacterium]